MSLAPKHRGVEQPILVLLACIPYDFKDERICDRPHCHEESTCMAAVLYGGQPYALALCSDHGQQVVLEIEGDNDMTRKIRGNQYAGKSSLSTG